MKAPLHRCFIQFNSTLKSDARPPLRSVRLIDQLRERIRYCHYSLKTEKAYVHWGERYIRFHGLRHPREMGPNEVDSFLHDLVNKRRCAPSTHKQALAAILRRISTSIEKSSWSARPKWKRIES
jgi:hypothetical protein